MTPRPGFTRTSSSKRPLSAIYIGSLPSSNSSFGSLSELSPPPESPGANSNHSGLPSPPATNSTGSGSTGDNNRNYDKSSNVTISNKMAPDDDDDNDDEHENDVGYGEDDTARLDRRRSLQASSDNASALQRVKSLAQRNRMAIDKLTSFSRLNTPSPSHGSRPAQSPMVSNTASSSSSTAASSSRMSSHSHSNSVPQSNHRRNDPTLSGSETERESHRSSHKSNTPSDLSVTPPSSVSASRGSVSYRERRISAPESPARAFSRQSDRRSSPGPSRTPRKRVSMMSSTPDLGTDRGYGDRRDITSAALAAVASSRRSPTSSGRRSRQPLPREFRERDRRNLDGSSAIEPATPHRQTHRDANGFSSTTSPKSAGPYTTNTQYSPRSARTNRASTVRELTRRHQTRWLSEDLSVSGSSTDDHVVNGDHTSSSYGRRQTQRGGSAENPVIGGLNGGRSLVGEGLRAAGITMRNHGTDDVFGHANDDGSDHSAPPIARARSSATGSSTGHADWDENGIDTRSRTSGFSGARVNEGSGSSGLMRSPTDLRAPLQAGADREVRNARRAGSATLARPATSMADLYHGEDESFGRTAPLVLRARRSAFPLVDRDPEPSTGSLNARSQAQQQQSTTRGVSQTPFSQDRIPNDLPSGRNGASSSLALSVQQTEHTRLMLESLSMFESQLSRLPPLGNTTTLTIPDLFRSAQTIVYASERLNSSLRAATDRALDEQIQAEMDDAGNDSNSTDIWRRVGADHRENLRTSDEVVRTMTAFLLGVGKVLRDASSAMVEGSQQPHLRSISLDDETTRRLSPEMSVGSGRRSQDGRRSAESRQSWEPLTRDTIDRSGRLSGRPNGIFPGPIRPPSSRDVADLDRDRPGSGGRITTTSSSSTRRLLIPREQRENGTGPLTAAQLTPSDVVNSANDYEPSPTPAWRQASVLLPERHRAHPPLAVPPPLPTLPSESLLRQSSTTANDQSSRRKISIASITTVRPSNPPFPLKTSNPTTAVTTHTVSNAPEESNFPLTRSDSGDSVRTNVTFSRPSKISLSALSGLQQQHNQWSQQDQARKRSGSMASSAAEVEVTRTSAPVVAEVRSPLSGSETERDIRRRTIGARSTSMSFDGSFDREREVEGGTQVQTIMLPSQRRERRRTVTEVFS